MEECQYSQNSTLFEGAGLRCPAVWDLLLCWPPTPAGEMAYLPCPPIKGIDRTKFAERKCLEDGIWESPPGEIAVTASSLINGSFLDRQGWTNYNNCFLPEIRDLLDKLDSGSAEGKMMVAYITRVLELTGLSISLIAVAISLFIFYHFRSLQNHRTRIHRNLFAAIGIQVIVRLTLYMDQSITNTVDNHPRAADSQPHYGIHTTAILCESFYIILEYARTTMFVWMFIEGLYLHNLITVMVFRPDTYHKWYLVLGWGIPVILTTIWAAFTATQQQTSVCWWGYNLTRSYWFLEGPRVTIILVNFLYLLNIIRVLVTKLRNSPCSEAEQLRKSVKAAVVLLPLLGITNALVMVQAPLDRSTLEFAFWSFTSHFLTSFQGFFVALIYCFLNGEVRTTLRKKFCNYVTDRRMTTAFLGSRNVSAYQSTQLEPERDDHQQEKHPRQLLRALRDNREITSAKMSVTYTTQV